MKSQDTKTPKELALQSGPQYDYISGHQDQGQDKKLPLDDGQMPVQYPQLGNRPVPQLHLSGPRFFASVMLALAALLGGLWIFVDGIVLVSDMRDELGSSKNADERVELYQTIKGFITALIGELLHYGFGAFLAVALAYIGNIRLYPGDDPRAGPGRVKRFWMWAFAPVILFLLNVAISATFVSHSASRIDRVFLKDDFISASSLSVSTAASEPSAGVSALDTILRGAVRGKITPFEILKDSPCVLPNGTSGENVEPVSLPSVKEVRSTAVVYGFSSQDWNLDAMPFGLKPSHSIKFQFSDVNTSTEDLVAKFSDYQAKADVSWLTTYELLLQGKLLFERSISDSNVSADYPCVWVDGLADLDNSTTTTPATNETATDAPPVANATTTRSRRRRRLSRTHRFSRELQETTTTEDDTTTPTDDTGLYDEEDFGSAEYDDGEFIVWEYYQDGEYKGQRKCNGAVSSLPDLANMADPAMHTMPILIDTMRDGFIKTVPKIYPEATDLTMETFEINPLMKLTVMTLDMPYMPSAEYRNLTEWCVLETQELTPYAIEKVFGNETATPTQMKEIYDVVCDQVNYPYLEPRATCGHSNCIFLDKSGTISFKKQLQLMPYLTNCSVSAMKYSADFLNFLPHDCVRQDDAVFLYGLGSYMGGDSFDSGIPDGIPFIANPQRHVVLTFAKLEWKLTDLSEKFKSDCGVNSTVSSAGCMGLVHTLQNVTVPEVVTKPGADTYQRILVLGKDALPSERMQKDFHNPIQLVTLNSRPFYYLFDEQYYEWEYLDKKRFKETNWPTNSSSQAAGGLTGDSCSPLIDSYLKQVDTNNFFIADPVQPLYTSALFYLFQDAALKTVKLTKDATTGVEVLKLSVVGTTNMLGDLEKHEIKFSLPLLSVIATFIGLGILVVMAILVLVFPSQRLEKSDATTVVEQFAELLKDDKYPEEVFDRGLLLPSGERVAMDEYVAESITFHHVRDEEKKIFL